MKKFFLKKRIVFFGIFLVIITAGLSFFQEDKGDSSLKTTSSELGIGSSSPAGVGGGLVIPASCPSDLHDAPWYGGACSTIPNACGMVNSGILQCDGSCSVSTPPPVSACLPVTADIRGSSLIGYGDHTLIITESLRATACSFDDGEVHPRTTSYSSALFGPLFETKTYRFSCVNTYSSSGWKEWTVNVCPITEPNFFDEKCNADPKPVPIVSISVSPSHLSYKKPDSGSVTFSWDSAKADSCTLMPPPPAVHTPTPPNTSNSMSVDYTRDKTGELDPLDLSLNIICSSAYGIATAAARVNFCTWDRPFWDGSKCVAGDTPPTVTLSALPMAILKRDSSLLTWVSTDAGSCFMSSRSWSRRDPEMKDEPVARSGSLLVSPPDDMDYSVECFSLDGREHVTDSVGVKVFGRSIPPPTAYIFSPKTHIPFNSSARLYVWSEYATQCFLRYYDYDGTMILSSITPNKHVDIITGNLTANRNYALQCNNGTEYTDWDSVFITLEPQTTTIAITPTYSDSIPYNGASSLRLTSTDTNICKLGYYNESAVWVESVVTPNTVVDIATGNLTATRTYNFRCDRSVTDTGPWMPLTVNVGPKDTLAICTEGGLTPFVKAGDPPASRNLYPNMSERLKAFYDTDPTDCAGTEVTSNWAQDFTNPAVSISGNGTTPQVITAGPTPGLSENVTLTQGSDTITLHYTVLPPLCIPNCSDAPNICTGTKFSASNCGINNCTGTRDCNYNLREVSP